MNSDGMPIILILIAALTAPAASNPKAAALVVLALLGLLGLLYAWPLMVGVIALDYLVIGLVCFTLGALLTVYLTHRS